MTLFQEDNMNCHHYAQTEQNSRLQIENIFYYFFVDTYRVSNRLKLDSFIKSRGDQRF